MSTATDDEQETMRRQVRLAVRQVVSRIDVELIGRSKGPKKVQVVVTMKDGQKRGFWYRTFAGRVIDGDVNYPDPEVFGAVDEVGFKPDQTVWFPTDTDPTENVRDQCRDMRSAGKSYKEICAAVGVVRSTVYRYINGRK